MIFLYGCNDKQKIEGVENISVQELAAQYQGDNDAILLDVRTQKEFDSGYIKDAIHIDVKEDDFVDKIQKLDKNKTVYVYCRTGKRSLEASKILKDNGFHHIKNVKGGIKAWNKYKLKSEDQ
ncbi:rhodanese-like domain-containing protein [Flavobacteriaceae bacterium Ap0902]|nr:rhodanese-like domain-containing protein [Flavobacteriaceae bacterium Ap0902]